jgi:hypothetical protein
MTASSKIRNIALSQLVLSPSNVRKTPATAAEDASLEASIRAHGIKQNLVVHPTPIDNKCIFRGKSAGDSGMKSATDSDLISAIPI